MRISDWSSDVCSSDLARSCSNVRAMIGPFVHADRAANEKDYMLRGALGRERERPRPLPRLLVPRPIRAIRPAGILRDPVAGHPHTQMIAARRKFEWTEDAIGKLGIEDVVLGHRPLSLGDVESMLKRRRSVGPAAGIDKLQRFAHQRSEEHTSELQSLMR